MRVLRSAVSVPITLGLLGGMIGGVSAAETDGQISYTSQPDRLAVFLNDVAYARDHVTLPGGVDVRIVLPAGVFADTLILRENGERVGAYRLDYQTGQPALEWRSASDSELREVTLEYLLGGVSWRPTYDMWLGAEEDETVDLDFFAEITDGSLSMADVDMQLVAGYVDLSSPLAPMAELSANQRLAGYGDGSTSGAVTSTGQVDIQHVYDIGSITADPGDTVYAQLVGGTMPARGVHLWNAQTDDQVTVIYKVTNTSDQPLAEGVVRSYQDGLFIGSDYIELTPVGSEGSVTVGHLQDVRVKREESRTAIAEGRFDYRGDVELTISNFTPTTIHIEVVDYRYPEAEALQASLAPQEEAGNILRWLISVEPEDEMVITYSFMVD
jgi:hypothetical protein